MFYISSKQFFVQFLCPYSHDAKIYSDIKNNNFTYMTSTPTSSTTFSPTFHNTDVNTEVDDTYLKKKREIF